MVKPIIGYFDDTTGKLDFDRKPLKTTKYWAKRAYNPSKLQGFRILKSSEGNYHVVFDRSVSWKENIEVIDWTALMVEGKQLKKCPLTLYALMCGIKGVSCPRLERKMRSLVPELFSSLETRTTRLRIIYSLKET